MHGTSKQINEQTLHDPQAPMIHQAIGYASLEMFSPNIFLYENRLPF